MKQITFTTQERTLRELLPAGYNPRKMTEKQNDDLRKSIEKFSLAEIPVINTDNTILAGHQRIRILTGMYGLDYKIDVRVPSRFLTEEECKEYNIRSNKNTGSWDWDKLANEFEETNLTDWGFEDWEMGGNSSFSADDFVNEDKKKELEDKKKLCPHCGGEL